MLTHPCSVHFSMFNFVAHYIIEYKFNNMLYFENSTFGVIVSWFGRVRENEPVDISDRDCPFAP